MAAAGGAVLLGGIVALLMLGSSHQTPTAPVALGGGIPAPGASLAPAGGPSSPTRKPGTKAGTSSIAGACRRIHVEPGNGFRAGHGLESLAPSRRHVPVPVPVVLVPAGQGTLTVTPARLTLAAAAGKVAAARSGWVPWTARSPTG